MSNTTKDHDEALIEELAEDAVLAQAYIEAALADDDPQVLLIALRHVTQARGGVAKVAEAAGIKRESLYRALSAKGNPRFSTLSAVLRALGLRLSVSAA